MSAEYQWPRIGSRGELGELLVAALDAHSDRTAIIPAEGEPWAFSRLRVAAIERGRWLARERPAAVGVVLPPGPAAVAWWLAAIVMRVPVTVLDDEAPEDVTERQLALFGADVVVRGAADGHDHDRVEVGAQVQRRPVAPAGSAGSWLRRSDRAGGEVVVFTSGTSGTPKAVVHSDRTLSAAVRITAGLRQESLGHQAGDEAVEASLPDLVLSDEALDLVFLNGMPMATVSGVTVLLQSLLVGATSVVPPAFAPGQFLGLIEKHRVTNLALSPHMAVALLRTQRRTPRDLGSVLAVGLGGGPAPPGLCAELEAQLGALVAIGYGSTETAGPVLMSRYVDPPSVRWQTVGRPAPGVDAKVVPDEDTLGIGRLLVRHPALCVGTLAPDGEIEPPTLNEGWFETGDKARREPDGNYTLHGRTSELILRGGRNIDPTAIEHVLETCTGVERAVVLGMPSRVPGEEDIWAVVQGDPGALDPTSLRRTCAERLGRERVPHHVRVVDELPLTADKSVRRSRVRAGLADGGDP